MFVPNNLLEEYEDYKETWNCLAAIEKLKQHSTKNSFTENTTEIMEDEALNTIENKDNIYEFGSIQEMNYRTEAINFGSSSDMIINFMEGDLKENLHFQDIKIKDNLNKQTSRTNSFKCDVHECDKQHLDFKSSRELKSHQKLEHSTLFCPQCNFVSLSEIDHLSHDCSKRHKCNECQRVFSTSHELKSHSYIHSGEKPHMCDFCGKGFRQRATLDRHKLTHESKRNFACNICHKKFKFKHYLVNHKLLHSGVKPHMCTYCGMKFAQNANMLKHIKQQHTNEKSHICNICGKGFVQPYYLRRHMNSHKQNQKDRTSMEMLIESNTGSDEQIGIRSCPCILCSVTCKGPTELQMHMKKHHDEVMIVTEKYDHDV